MNVEELRAYLEWSWLPVPEVGTGGRVVERGPGYALVSFGRVGPFSNWVLDTTVEEDSLGTVVRAADAFFHRGTAYSWLVLPHQEWLAQALQTSGHVLLEEVQCMALHLESYHPAPAPRTEIRRVCDEKMLRIALSIDDSYSEHSSQQLEESLQRSLHKLGGEDEQWFLAYVGGNPAAMTHLQFLDERRIAYFSGATTLPGYRNRGLYKALVRHRLELGRQRGALWAATHGDSDTSAPILRKFGFQSLSRLRVYSRETLAPLSGETECESSSED